MIARIIIGISAAFSALGMAWFLHKWHLASREFTLRNPKEIDDETA